jgi:hypothetical protein
MVVEPSQVHATTGLMCRSDSECPPPPSSCFAPTAECFANICDYHPIDCGDRSCIAGACAESPLRFDVTIRPPVNRQSLARGDAFIGRIRNVSAEPVTVSMFAYASVHIAYLKNAARRRLEPAPISHSYTSRAPESTAALSLRTLRPGESVSLPIGLADIPIKFGVPRGFGIPIPGRYTARFYYSYTGKDAGFVGVFHGVVQSHEVAFNVE